MIQIFEFLINNHFKFEMECLYGSGSMIKVDDFMYSTNKKSYVVLCKVLIEEPTNDLYINFPDGIEYLIDWVWKIVGMTEGLIKINTIDLK